MADESDDAAADVDARLEALEARVDEQAAQLRFIWGLFLYGIATLIVSALVPQVGLILGLMGAMFGCAVAVARVT